MLIAMPLLLVATVSCRRGRERASSNAYCSTRSAPNRENTDSWITISRSVPAYMMPPRLVYSPSVFSRTPSGITSLPMPSPGIAAMRKVGVTGSLLQAQTCHHFAFARTGEHLQRRGQVHQRRVPVDRHLVARMRAHVVQVGQRGCLRR